MSPSPRRVCHRRPRRPRSSTARQRVRVCVYEGSRTRTPGPLGYKMQLRRPYIRTFFSKRSVKSNGRKGRRLSPPRAGIKEYFRHGHVLLPRRGGNLSTTSTSSIPPRSRKSQSPIHDDLIMDQRGPTIDSLGDPWESRSSRCTSFEAPNLKRAGRILCQWSIMRRKEP
jgi:hypothetical protein